jgi:endonuclease-3
MKNQTRIVEALRRLSLETRRGRYREAPVYQGPIEGQRTAFRTLVGCLISTRTRDEQTTQICRKLFAVISSPESLLSLPDARLEKILYGAGFYRQKTKQLKKLARMIIDKGGVPRTREELLDIPGIGPKCANIVLAASFGRPVIAVDIHVHRISNRMDWVRTATPEKTEQALTPNVPVRWRRRVNVLLVSHGQLICKPIGPRCEECSVSAYCRRRGVGRRARPTSGG